MSLDRFHRFPVDDSRLGHSDVFTCTPGRGEKFMGSPCGLEVGLLISVVMYHGCIGIMSVSSVTATGVQLSKVIE